MEHLKYEYIRLVVDLGDLAELNSLGSAGWRAIIVFPGKDEHSFWVLLERGSEGNE